MIGPRDGEGEESFEIVVCTPKWLTEKYKAADVLLGLHKVIVFEYDYRRLRGFIEKFLMRCSGDNWNEVAGKVSLLGHWEFEGYRPKGEDKPATFGKEARLRKLVFGGQACAVKI